MIRRKRNTTTLPALPLNGDAAVDLHLHTIASDGFWTPQTLIDYLAENGFAVAAVCDHDTQRSVAEAIDLGLARGIRIVPGVEVTCNWEKRQLHVLIYGIDPRRTDDTVQPFLLLMQQIDIALQKAAWDAKRRFEEADKPLPSLEKIRNGRPLWPFHVLSAAIEDKHAKNLTEAANMLTSLGGTFTADLPVAEVVEAAHRAGGVCIIAHPGRADAVGVVTEADLDRMLQTAPIDGLEAHYRSYSDEQTAQFRALAAEKGMLISCGSDSHAPNQPVNPRAWKAAWCADILARLEIPVESSTISDPSWTKGMDPLAVAPKPEVEAPAQHNGTAIEKQTDNEAQREVVAAQEES